LKAEAFAAPRERAGLVVVWEGLEAAAGGALTSAAVAEAACVGTGVVCVVAAMAGLGADFAAPEVRYKVAGAAVIPGLRDIVPAIGRNTADAGESGYRANEPRRVQIPRRRVG
jgi:hypothetical protein